MLPGLHELYLDPPPVGGWVIFDTTHATRSVASEAIQLSTSGLGLSGVVDWWCAHW